MKSYVGIMTRKMKKNVENSVSTTANCIYYYPILSVSEQKQTKFVFIFYLRTRTELLLTLTLVYIHSMCVFMCGRFLLLYSYQMLILMAFVGVAYLLLSLPPTNVHIISLIYAMLCITAAHIYRLWTDYGGFHLDFTGPFMLMVQRVTYVAFSYRDGILVKESELRNNEQKFNRISKHPSLLEYSSYCFCFLKVLAGPTCTYNEYLQMITGDNFKKPKGVQEDLTPSAFIPALKKFIISIVSLIIFVSVKDSYGWTDTMLADTTPLYLRYTCTIIFCFIVRCRYYFVYSITESISNVAGLGFYYDPDTNKPKWDLVKTVDIMNFEFGVNCKVQTTAWNVCSQKWLKRVVYERQLIPNFSPVLTTFLISAWWHGFYPGYYMSFLFLAFVTQAAQKIRNLVWHRFQSPRIVKILYDIIGIISVNICKDFGQLAFVFLSFEMCIQVWKLYYFLPLIVTLFLLAVLPSKKKVKKTKEDVYNVNGTLTHEDKKHQ